MAIQKITSGILADGAIVATDIADGSITTAKIADANVTAAKLATGAALPSQSGNTTYYLTTDGTNSIWKAQTALAVANTQLTGSIEATQVGTTVSQLFGMRNRIINGDMRIDQRNAGASVTPTAATAVYTVDRWFAYQEQASKFSVQQVSANANISQGFDQSLRVTSLSAYTVGSAEVFQIQQRIEGYNISDLAWGTASAKTVTLSFWVYSSLTGTFGGSIRNASADRSYPFSYTISSANTWTKATITVSGDTTGTWLTTNGVGIIISFGLGIGSTLSNTAGSWYAGNYVSATGATSVVGTNGATFYITGVQLEVGTSATPFERRQYGQELALCQRYYEKSYDIGTVPGTNTDVGILSTTVNSLPAGADTWPNPIRFQVSKRSAPTISIWDRAGNASKYSSYASSTWSNNNGSITIITIGQNGCYFTSGATNGFNTNVHYTASAEL